MINSVDILNVEVYKEIFELINKRYVDYCKNEFHSNLCNKYNLRKTLIRDIARNDSIDDEFQRYINRFCDGMDGVRETIYNEIVKYNSLSFKLLSRTKTDISIEDKIIKKLDEGEGKFQINNYLNDLIGFRIIDINLDNNIGYIKNLIKTKNSTTAKIIHRDKEGYKAHHIYLKESNYSFPIEIQLWDEKDENNNINAHKNYKQKYKKVLKKQI